MASVQALALQSQGDLHFWTDRLIGWWGATSDTVTSTLDQHGLLAGFFFLLVDESGAPTPVPGNVLMVVLGMQARRGFVSLWQAILVMELATLIGASVLYGISAWAGRSIVYQFGRYIALTPNRVQRAERWLNARGFRAVIIARLIPGTRIVTAVACGVLLVPWRTYFPAMALGALIYIAGYALLGYTVGEPVLHFLERTRLLFHLPVL